MSIFGAIKLAGDIEDAALLTLESWFPVYKKEVELQMGLAPGTLVAPKAWLKANTLDREAGDSMPAIVAVSPGLSSRQTPKQEGDGTFRVWFSIGLGVFVSADRRSHTMDLVRIYTALVRTIMLQKQSLGGVADGTTWLDESYDDNFPFLDDQTISAGQVIFDVEVAGVVSRFGGPTTGAVLPVATPDPATQPGSEWPLVATVTSSVDTKG